MRFINGRAYSQAELLDKGKYRVLRVGNFNTNTSWYYSDLELEDDKYANKGDLLYLWATSFGPEIWEQERVIYHYHIWKIEILDENIDKQYLYSWLETDKERIKQMTNGTTMVHVTKGLIEERSFQFPIYKQEQVKIGTFLKQIDDTITLHQRQLKQLELIKQALLQKLFLKTGQIIPELRFRGFNESWKQRKFQEFISVNSGRDYKHLKIGDIPVYGTGGYMLSVNDKLSNNDSIGLGRKGTIDKPQLLKAPFWTVDTLFFMTPRTNYDLLFLYSMTQKINWKRMDESTGVPSLSKSVIENVQQRIPSYQEQIKIGNFFKKLDDTITLHQRKINCYQQSKKSLLTKMFT